MNPQDDSKTEPTQTMADAAEMLWLMLANVSGGDWTKQTVEWQAAAARWRDNYFAVLDASKGVASPDPQEQTEAQTETPFSHDREATCAWDCQLDFPHNGPCSPSQPLDRTTP